MKHINSIKNIFTRSLIFIFLPLLSNAQTVWTFEECLNYAHENNITIKQYELSTKIAENEVLKSKLALIPEVSANTSYGFNFGNSIDPTTYQFVKESTQSSSFSSSGSMPLFTSLQQINNIKRTKFELEKSNFELEAIKEDISLSIATYFLQIMLNKEILTASEKQFEITNEQYNQTKKFIDAGALPSGDLLDIDAQLASDQFNIITAENNLNNSLIALKLLLQIDPYEPFDIQAPIVSVEEIKGPENFNPKATYLSALQNRPDIKAAGYNLLSAEKSLSIAKGSLYPSIFLSGSLRSTYFSEASRLASSTPTDGTFDIGYLQSNPGEIVVANLPPTNTFEKTPFSDQLKDNFNQSVSISMNIPIISGWQKRINIDNAKLGILNAQYTLQATKNNLQEKINTAYSNMVAAFKSLDASQKSVSAFEKSFNYAQNKFDLGAINSFDLLNVKNRYSIAESDVLKAKYDYLFKQKILEFYQGKQLSFN